MAKAPKVEVQSAALKHVVDLNNKFDSMLSSRRGKWLDWYKMYRLFRTEQTQPWQSRLFIPKVYEIIEKLTPAIIAHNPRYIVTPRFNQAIPFIGILRDYLNYVWEEEEMQSKIEGYLKDGLVYGTAIGKVGWRTITGMETSEEPVLNEDTGELEARTVEEEVVKLELPTFELIDIFDFKTDPFEEDLENSVANIHSRKDVSINELRADEDIYFPESRGLPPGRRSRRRS